MDLRTIVTLKTILAEGSFQKAAQRLHYSQSTITFQIRQLENELGFSLFEKIGRRMVLNRAGEEILPHLDSILESMKRLEDYGKGKGQLTGELKVAVGESLLVYKLQPILQAFTRRAPEVRLSLLCLNCHLIKDHIVAGEVDIGVYYDVCAHPSTLVLDELGTFPVILAAPPDMAPRLLHLHTPGGRPDVSLVINEPRSIYREILENYFKRNDIVLKNTVELWSIEAIKKSVASGLGFTYLPRFTMEEELLNGSLVEVPFPAMHTEISAILVRHRNKWVSPAMRLFMDLLLDMEGTIRKD